MAAQADKFELVPKLEECVFKDSGFQNVIMKVLNMPDGVGFINIELKNSQYYPPYFSMVIKYPLKAIHCFEMPELYNQICTYITENYQECKFPSRQFGYNSNLIHMEQINYYINGDSLESICHQIEKIIFDYFTNS